MTHEESLYYILVIVMQRLTLGNDAWNPSNTWYQIGIDRLWPIEEKLEITVDAYTVLVVAVYRNTRPPVGGIRFTCVKAQKQHRSAIPLKVT